MTYGILAIFDIKAQVSISGNGGRSSDAIAGSSCGEGPRTSKGVGLFSAIVRSAIEGYGLSSDGVRVDTETEAWSGESSVVELDGLVGTGEWIRIMDSNVNFGE